MARKVFDLHRREWSLRRNIEWSVPATGEDFEHDVDGGRGAAGLVLSGLFAFWMILVIWKPAEVHIPWFYWLVFFIILVFFPVRWALRRPWTVVAETVGGYDQPAELWTGLVRGEAKSREEMRIVKRRLEIQGTPGHSDSPLQPVS
ncbi:MAG: hypothetical protein ACRDRK_21830 [Pseudonocardia sp.]